MSRSWQNVLLSFASLILALALAEGILRVLYPTPGRNEVSSLEYRHDWIFNSDGFRDDEFSQKIFTSKKKVIFLGDSFTMGMGVNRSESYASLLSDAFTEKIQSFNLGRIGTGTIAQSQILESVLPKIKPNAVVLFFYWNDVQDDLNQAKQSEDCAVAVPQTVENTASRPFFNSLSFAKPFLRKTLLYRWASLNYRVLLAKLGIAKLDFQIEFDFFKVDPSAAVDGAWGRTGSALGELKALCERSGSALIVAYVPKREQINGWENIVKFYGATPEEVDRFSVNKRLRKICLEKGISFLDVSEALEEDAGKEKFYYRFDTHFTSLGNRAYADALKPSLNELLEF